MDLRAYYRTLRGIEADIHDDSVVIISRETSDGGRAGVKGDVRRALGARLITDEKADLATPEESAEFRAEVEAKWKAAHLPHSWPVTSRATSSADRETPNAPSEKS